MIEPVRQYLVDKLEVLRLSEDVVQGNPDDTKEIVLEIYGMLQTMKEGIRDKKEEIQVMNKQIQAANRYCLLSKEYITRVNYISQNIPPGARAGPTNKGRSHSPAKVPTTGKNKKVECFACVQYLTLKEFDSIPSYMKGRTQYETISTVVDELNAAIESKYRFLGKTFANMSNLADKKRYKLLKSQENQATKGLQFVTADDLKSSNLLKAETNRRNYLTILRHFKKVREVRGPGSIVRIVPV